MANMLLAMRNNAFRKSNTKQVIHKWKMANTVKKRVPLE